MPKFNQTHLQFAQANSETKNFKGVCLFASTFLSPRKSKIETAQT